METFELGIIDVLRVRQMEDDDGVCGGITHIKKHKRPSKLEEVTK